MKKIVLILLLVVIGGGVAKAQFGVNAGVSNRTELMQLSGLQASESLLNYGGYAGVDMSFDLSSMFFVDLGVEVFGYKGDVKREDNVKMMRQVLDLEVPLWLRYRLKLTEKVGVSVFVGPRVNYCLTFKETLTGTSSSVDRLDVEVEGDNVLNRLSYSGNAGVALHLGQFRVSVDYCVGVKDMMSRNSNKSLKYNRMNVGVGLKF